MIWKMHNKKYGKCGNQDIVIVMGDMNGNECNMNEVGSEQGPLKEIVGGHGLG